eukprot:TRINITY_DN591_c0_g1_i3.p1 TRINITY_DN591_c0_g1~~TRINITY_DN591_c0_g1_i3.p1  ORF type:complete len:419 (+),score=176.21 TRINITY_DN591_c0_g1_i3:61-1317(+)
MAAQRDFDIAVYGATGFTGKLVAQYLAKNYASIEAGVQGEVPVRSIRFALAGRQREKIEAIKKTLVAINPVCENVGIIVADSSQPESLEEVARRSTVMLSCAGPFALYGDPVVAACVKYGTHYVDITGESTWVRTVINRFGQEAEAKNAVIVPMCGFDSIPSDLGVLYTLQQARKLYNAGVSRIDNVVTMGGGGVSGGTLASVSTMLEGPRGRLTEASHPFFLNPNPDAVKATSHDKDQLLVGYNSQLKVWTMPFVMAAVNCRVVRRSAALNGYGNKFTYNESMRVGGLPLTIVFYLGLVIFAILFFFKFTRKLLLKTFLPAPGQGPSEETRRKAFFRCTFAATTDDEKNPAQFVTTVSGGDPGYDETAKMVAESAICLALQYDQLPRRGGVLTPASAMGDLLIRRLVRAGIKFDTRK